MKTPMSVPFMCRIIGCRFVESFKDIFIKIV